MAAPNIVNVATITAKTVGAALTTTLTTDILANAASSGKVFKINTIMIANIDGSNAVNVDVDWYDGTNAYKIAKTIQVPPDETLVLTDKNTTIYLEEGHKIRGGASAASDANIIISYEEIS